MPVWLYFGLREILVFYITSINCVHFIIESGNKFYEWLPSLNPTCSIYVHTHTRIYSL